MLVETKVEIKAMLKLYKEIDGQLHYWETWDKGGKTAVVHWGIVGQQGDTKKIKSIPNLSLKETVQLEIEARTKEGYEVFDRGKMVDLEVEYKIDDFGSKEDLDKRHRLESYLDNVLGWTGLGHVDGGSIGSGTMEVGCVVVDFDIAKNVLENVLKHPDFKDYSRIYRLSEDDS